MNRLQATVGDPPVGIVYGDDRLAVVEKPAGMIVYRAPGHVGPTLVDALGDYLGGGEAERPGIVHRLDLDTSGLMLVARDGEAHAALSRAIRLREVERRYLALVDGRPKSRSGTIDAPLGRDQRSFGRRAVGGRGAREARTHFRVVEPLRSETLVEAKLESGRTHQIRVHFAAIGHPLLGDSRYGGPGRYGTGRQFLHSARLGFMHPFDGRELEFESPLPPDLAAVLAAARAASDG